MVSPVTRRAGPEARSRRPNADPAEAAGRNAPLRVNKSAKNGVPALPPDRPIAPSRKKILVLGAGASFGLAMGLALLLEMLNPALRSTSQFQRQLEIAPLASIPYVRTRVERRRRIAILALAALFVAVALPAGLWAVDRHVQPIQSLIDRAMGRASSEGG